MGGVRPAEETPPTQKGAYKRIDPGELSIAISRSLPRSVIDVSFFSRKNVLFWVIFDFWVLRKSKSDKIVTFLMTEY